jgi:hypothetical protein
MKQAIQTTILMVITVLILTTIVYANSTKWNVKSSGCKYSMVVYGDIYINNQKVDWSDGYYIAAFGPKGEKDCRSIKQVGDIGKDKPKPGMFYLTITSNANYPETINFKVWDSINDITYDVSQTVMFENQETVSNTSFDLIAR